MGGIERELERDAGSTVGACNGASCGADDGAAGGPGHDVDGDAVGDNAGGDAGDGTSDGASSGVGDDAGGREGERADTGVEAVQTRPGTADDGGQCLSCGGRGCGHHDTDGGQELKPGGKTNRRRPGAPTGAACPEVTEGVGAVRPAAMPAAVTTGVAAAPAAAGTLEGAGRARGKSGTESASDDASSGVGDDANGREGERADTGVEAVQTRPGTADDGGQCLSCGGRGCGAGDDTDGGRELKPGGKTNRRRPGAPAGAACPEVTEGVGAARPAAVPAVLTTGVAAAPAAAGTLEAIGRAHGKSGTESACHTASVEQHPCTGDGWGGVPGPAGGAIPPASPPRFSRPEASRSGGIEREHEQDSGVTAAPGDSSWPSRASRRV